MGHVNHMRQKDKTGVWHCLVHLPLDFLVRQQEISTLIETTALQGFFCSHLNLVLLVLMVREIQSWILK